MHNYNNEDFHNKNIYNDYNTDEKDYYNDYNDCNDYNNCNDKDYYNEKDYYNDYNDCNDKDYNENAYNDYYNNDEYKENAYRKIQNKYGAVLDSYEIEDENNDSIDDDLLEYFSDAHVFSSKKATNKKRNKRIIYKTDDNIVVLANKVKNKGIILFGPYDCNKKNMYQIELANGDIIEADEKHISYQ